MTHFTDAQKQWCWFVNTYISMLCLRLAYASQAAFWCTFSDFCPFNSAQVSIGKVLLGVFGVAVVVILIAVPTAIYLKGESFLLNVDINASFVFQRTFKHIRKKVTHASLRMIRLDRFPSKNKIHVLVEIRV